MSQTILYIDGENLKHYLKNVLLRHKIKSDDIDYSKLDFSHLFTQVLKGYQPNQKIFYSAKLQLHQDSPEKSQDLIDKHRLLKTHLEKAGFECIVSGHVRPQIVGKNIVFKEKGVDVRIAVDMVASACDKTVKTAILCSSDSDLQPAINEVRNRGVEVIYVGFKGKSNKGLSYTTNKTILISDSEIINNYKKPPNQKRTSHHR